MHKMMINGTTVSYSDQGSGPLVVLLHSSAATQRQWDGVREYLGQGYRVIAPNLMGYGGTDGLPHKGACRLSDETRVIRGFIESFGEDVHLVGHSYGGALALRLALEDSSKLLSLTLIEPVAFFVLREGNERDRSHFREVANVAEGVIKSAADSSHIDGLRGFVDYWNGTGAWNRCSLKKHEALRRVAPTIAMNFRTTMWESVSLDAFSWMNVPTLVIRGGESTAPARRIAVKLVEMLPNASLHSYPNGGHMLPNSHPGDVAEAITFQINRSGQTQRQAG